MNKMFVRVHGKAFPNGTIEREKGGQRETRQEWVNEVKYPSQ